MVIDSQDTAGKGSGFAEGYEDGFMDFSARVYLYAHMQEDHSTEHHQCGDDQLGNIFWCVFHTFLWVIITFGGFLPFVSGRLISQ